MHQMASEETRRKKVLVASVVVVVLILAFKAWFHWNNDQYVPERKELNGTSRYIISWYQNSGNYALHSVDSPDSYYIGNAPSDLDKWLDREVYITGKLVATKHTLRRPEHGSLEWNPAVWAVDIANIEPIRSSTSSSLLW